MKNYNYFFDTTSVRFLSDRVKGADGYQIAKKFYEYDAKDNNGKKIDYTTYVFETQDGAYSDFGVRPYKVVNGQTIYGPWKFFPKTDQK